MAAIRRTILERGARVSLPWIAALALAIFMTWPLARGLGSLGRTGVGPNADPGFGTNGDGMFSLWNVSWVARTIVADPVNLFHANIFHPHKNTLAFSEANLLAGLVGVPAWWTSKNPYTTLNIAILFAFTTAWYCMWLLARYLTRDPWAAATAATAYAFCPYVFAHTAHIQLMLTGGIPLAMLMLHRLVDAPGVRRGIALGAALLAQALACAYYGIFAGLMVGFGVLFFTVSRRLLRDRAWWIAVAVAALVAVAGVAPFLMPYYEIRQDEGFARTLQDSVRYSANAASYLASAATAHRWLLTLISGWPRWSEVMFPGILPILFAVFGAVWTLTRRDGGVERGRETALLYGALGILALWSSFGPAAGLYSALYYTVPVFSFLRAPSRLAIVVALCVAVFAALGVRQLVALTRWRQAAAALVCAVVVAELSTVMPWERALAQPVPYAILGNMPKGPMAEFPFYGGRVAWHLHTQYMVFSTSHWLPMLNGYSDHTPAQFREDAIILDSFPSNDAFRVLQRGRVRYIGVHWDMFGTRAEEIRTRLGPFEQHLRPLAATARMSLYEIVSFP